VVDLGTVPAFECPLNQSLQGGPAGVVARTEGQLLEWGQGELR
jgi:hypothetical protein